MSKRQIVILLVVVAALLGISGSARADTWYVRADGGSRDQCDGKTDAAYPGHGNNRHCALGDVRYLWDHQEYGKLRWVIAGGDTVILDNTKQWRIGWDENGTDRAHERWCAGWEGGPYGCYNPPIPAGTAQQHTRILGRNYGKCSVNEQPDKSKMTQLFGGYGVNVVLNLDAAQFVDVECVELTRHSQCLRHGEPRLPSACKSDVPLDDYDGTGIVFNNQSHDVLLQDMWVHGHTDRGIIGPIGGTVTANRIDISTNGMAGWDFDDGSGTPSINGVLRMSHSTIEWSGCNQQYPAVDPIPVVSCYGQSNGGYGDGIGTPAKYGMDAYIDHSVFRYNVQDGEDFGHVDSGGHNLSITNSLSYGNGGGQFKWGANFTHVVFVNNIAIGNCTRMSKPMAGVPSSYDANLGDFCRSGDAISFNFHQDGTAIFDNNTIVSYTPTTFDIDCWEQSCSNSHLVFRNNIVLGIDNKATYDLGGKAGGPGGFYFQHPIGHIERSHNIFFGLRNERCGATEICKDPKLLGERAFHSEEDLDNFNATPAPGSPARGAGMPIPDLKTDFDGKPRPASGNYTIGAIQ